MTALAMQKRIIAKLKDTSDKNLLADIYKLLSLSEETEKLFALSAIQKAGIRKGLKDIDEGRTMSHQKAKKDIEKWFSK